MLRLIGSAFFAIQNNNKKVQFFVFVYQTNDASLVKMSCVPQKKPIIQNIQLFDLIIQKYCDFLPSKTNFNFYVTRNIDFLIFILSDIKVILN